MVNFSSCSKDILDLKKKCKWDTPQFFIGRISTEIIGRLYWNVAAMLMRMVLYCTFNVHRYWLKYSSGSFGEVYLVCVEYLTSKGPRHSFAYYENLDISGIWFRCWFSKNAIMHIFLIWEVLLNKIDLKQKIFGLTAPLKEVCLYVSIISVTLIVLTLAKRKQILRY